jgi:hypothetical protein
MGTYIPQTPNNDFVYPNNDRVEYDLELCHPINDNSPTGSISGLTLTVNSTGSQLTIDYDYEWDRNGSIFFERFYTNNIGYLSVHMMTPDQDYMKPWRIVDSVSSATPSDTYSGSRSITVNASDFGITEFPGGTYTFEFRLISELSVTVLCDTYEVPVWTGCTCTAYDVTNTSSESLLTVQYVNCDTGFVEFIDVDPDGNIILCACEDTAITLSGSGLIVADGFCVEPDPTATPTPSPTATLTPTPTPSPTVSCTYWELVAPTQSGELLTVEYNDCDGNPQEITLGWNGATEFICAETGSVVVTEQGLGSSATDTGTPCG